MSIDNLAGGWSKAFGIDRKHFNMFFDKMMDGFAYHKIIIDQAGRPIDYIFLEVNSAFEKLTGLRRERIIGKKVTEVLKGIEDDPANWIGVYGRVALMGEPIEFENFAQPLGKWFKVSAYCPEKGYFAAIFEDITARKKAEDSLKQSEQRWATTLRSIGDAVIATDTEGNVTFMNKVAEDLTGWTSAEACQKPLPKIFNIINNHTRKEIESPANRVIKENVIVGLANHTVLIRKDGSEVPIDDSSAPIKDQEGKLIGVILVFRDITDREKAEADLRKLNDELEKRVQQRTEQVSVERQRLYNVLETLPVYVILLDKDYRVPFANKVFRETFGESHGRRCHEYLFNKDHECENCETYKVYKQNKPQHWYWTGPNGRDYDIYDFPFKEADGSTLILEMGIDITERKRAENALRAERERFFGVLDSLPVMISLLTIDHKIAFSNKLFNKRFGDSKGKQCFTYLFGKSKPCEWCEAFKVLETGQPHYWRLNCPDGSVFDVWNSPHIDVDGSHMVLEVDVDVTDRVRLEKQLEDSERLAAIGATAGMVGHDIRNPLQAITSDVFLIESELASIPESEERSKALESLSEIGKNVDYINKIVQDLQDYARPLNPKIEEVDLKQIIEGIIKRSNHLPSNINVEIEIAKNARKIQADSYYLNRILYNLITNSVQAMPNGGKLSIRASKDAEDTILSVEDKGIGIPKEIHEKMFTLLFTTKSKGQGFGLPVVKRMTESLGGTVTFRSEEGKGTIFTIRLPRPKR